MRRATGKGGKVVNIRRGTSPTRSIKEDKDRIEGKSPEEGAGRAAHADAPAEGVRVAKATLQARTHSAASRKPEKTARHRSGEA